MMLKTGEKKQLRIVRCETLFVFILLTPQLISKVSCVWSQIKAKGPEVFWLDLLCRLMYLLILYIKKRFRFTLGSSIVNFSKMKEAALMTSSQRTRNLEKLNVQCKKFASQNEVDLWPKANERELEKFDYVSQCIELCYTSCRW